MADIAEIAAGLTEAQRKGLMNARARMCFGVAYVDAHHSTLKALKTLGLIEPSARRELSKTGLAVAAYLKDQTP